MKNQTFIQCFLKSWIKLTKEERVVVAERRKMLNSKFVFTEDAILRLRRINDILQEQAIRIRKQAIFIHALQEKQLKEKVIEDSEVEIELHCWNNRYYVRWDREFYGNPFYSDYALTLFDTAMEAQFFTENWNEYINQPDHPLSKEFYCYLFHHLSDHTYLAWDDILRIDEIWIEIKAWNQFFIKFPKEVKAVKNVSE